MKKELNYTGGCAPYCKFCVLSKNVSWLPVGWTNDAIVRKSCYADVMGIHHTKPFKPCSRLKFHEKDEEALKNCLKEMAQLLGDEIKFTKDEK